VLEALSQKVDTLIVGGGIANTFIAAAGFDVGRSLHEPGLIEAAKRIRTRVQVPEVIDVVVSDQLHADARAVVKPVEAVTDADMILDLGPQTMAALLPMIQGAATIIWNGPLGVFEFEAFAGGTRTLTEAIAASPAFSLAGGGDTLAAIDAFGAADQISYISTGGGAFLEFVEGKTLPAIAALEARVAQDQLVIHPLEQE
jgi:phosphoglycerate kinase